MVSIGIKKQQLKLYKNKEGFMAIKIEKREDHRVTLTHTAMDENGNTIVTFNASIGTGEYEAGSYNRVIANKSLYFRNLAKYKEVEQEFESAYEEEATKMYGGNENETVK